MRTIAWETAPQIVLRDGSQQTKRKVSYIWDFGEGEYMQSSTFFFFFAEVSLIKRNSHQHEGI